MAEMQYLSGIQLQCSTLDCANNRFNIVSFTGILGIIIFLDQLLLLSDSMYSFAARPIRAVVAKMVKCELCDHNCIPGVKMDIHVRSKHREYFDKYVYL